MSSFCQSKTGIVFQRICNRPAAGVCQNCRVTVCEDHLVKDELGELCSSCFKKEHGDKKPVLNKNSKRIHDDYDDDWYYYDESHFGGGYIEYSDEISASEIENMEFTDEDYQAFDQVMENNEFDLSDSYDS